jgi:hypothetical protein
MRDAVLLAVFFQEIADLFEDRSSFLTLPLSRQFLRVLQLSLILSLQLFHLISQGAGRLYRQALILGKHLLFSLDAVLQGVDLNRARTEHAFQHIVALLEFTNRLAKRKET